MKKLIFVLFLFLFIPKVYAVDITQKVGNTVIGANSYFPATRGGNSYQFDLSYLYNASNSADSDFANKYNLNSAFSGNNSNPNKVMYYFVLGYCSNVGASIVSISNTNFNFIDLNFNTYTACTVNNGSQYYSGTLWNLYFRMSPTSTNVGNSSLIAVDFDNTINVASQFTYNGYIGFNSLSILTRDEYETYLQNQKEINNQNTIINNQNSIINGQNNINNNLTDDSLPSTTGWLDSWTDLLLENNQVNQILYLPVNILNKVSFQSKNTCTPIVMPFGLTGGNETLTFNCWQITDYLGNTVGELITGLVGFYLLYYFALFLWKFYDDFTSLKDTLSLILANDNSLVVKGDNNG